MWIFGRLESVRVWEGLEFGPKIFFACTENVRNLKKESTIPIAPGRLFWTLP